MPLKRKFTKPVLQPALTIKVRTVYQYLPQFFGNGWKEKSKVIHSKNNLRSWYVLAKNTRK